MFASLERQELERARFVEVVSVQRQKKYAATTVPSQPLATNTMNAMKHERTYFNPNGRSRVGT